jgi:hypothetical protein
VAAVGLPWLVGAILAVLALLIVMATAISRRRLWRLAVPAFKAFNAELPFAQLPIQDLVGREPSMPATEVLSPALLWTANWDRPPKGAQAEAMLDVLFDLASAFAPASGR